MKKPIKYSFVFAFLFLLSNKNFAQTPGGVRTGLHLWLKADVGTTVSGTTVTGWNDQSGNTFNLTGLTSTGPALATGILNYNPGLAFNSTHNYLKRAAPGIFGTGTSYSNLNYYIVYNSSDASSFHWMVYQGTTGFDRFSHSMNYSGTTEGDLDATTTNRLSYTTATGVPLMVSYMNSSTAITGTSKSLLYLNAKLIQSNTAYTPYVGVNDQFQVGDQTTSSVDAPNSPFLGNMHEIILYTGANTLAQRRQIESYLAIKYGDTLNESGSSNGVSSNYVNSSGTSIYSDFSVPTYWNNVIGIARDDSSGLYQKQSHQLDDSARIYLSALAATNSANTGTFSSNNQFVVMGNNKLSMANTGSTQYPAGITGRMGREWQITNTGCTASYSIDIKLPSTFCVIDPTQLKLIVGNNSNLTTGTVFTALNGLIFSYASGVITIGNITNTIIPLNSTKYFTLNISATAASVGGTRLWPGYRRGQPGPEELDEMKARRIALGWRLVGVLLYTTFFRQKA